MSAPSKAIRPRVGGIWPVSILKNVLLPAPLGPIRQRNSPAAEREVDARDGVHAAEALLQADGLRGSGATLHAALPRTRRSSQATAPPSPEEGPRGTPARTPSAGRRESAAATPRPLASRDWSSDAARMAVPTIGPISVDLPPTMTQIDDLGRLVEVEHLRRHEVVPDGVQHAGERRDAGGRDEGAELVAPAVIAQEFNASRVLADARRARGRTESSAAVGGRHRPAPTMPTER